MIAWVLALRVWQGLDDFDLVIVREQFGGFSGRVVLFPLCWMLPVRLCDVEGGLLAWVHVMKVVNVDGEVERLYRDQQEAQRSSILAGTTSLVC